MPTIGQRVRTLRLQRHLTQRELGDRLGVGRERVKQIEEWPGGFYTASIVSLCKALECTPNELIDMEE